jgi:hypothetical protein
MGFYSFSFFTPLTQPSTSTLHQTNQYYKSQFPHSPIPKNLSNLLLPAQKLCFQEANQVPEPLPGQLNPNNHLNKKSQSSSWKGSAYLNLSNYLMSQQPAHLDPLIIKKKNKWTIGQWLLYYHFYYTITFIWLLGSLPSDNRAQNNSLW